MKVQYFTLHFLVTLSIIITLILPPSMQSASVAVALFVGLGILTASFRYPEIALVLFLNAGQFKAAPIFDWLQNRLDLTVAFAVLLLLSMFRIIFLERYPVIFE